MKVQVPPPPSSVTDSYVKHERSSNLELYRIIVMLLIVMHHYVVNSDLVHVMEQYPTAIKSIYLYITGAWGKTGINCFVLITGYFMCKSHITLHKFLKLILQMEFYSIIIGSIFLITGYSAFSLQGLIDMVNPIGGISRNFSACFIIFFLFIPFLNACINNISQRQHLALLSLCVFTYTILGTDPFINVEFNYITWFSVLYVIASYIRKYKIPYNDNFRVWAIATMAFIVISVVSMLFILYLYSTLGKSATMGFVIFFVSETNKALALAVSICSFMMFKNLPLKHSRVINTIASCTFGVLLIHAASRDMRRWLWHDVCNNVGMYHQSGIYIHAIVIPIIVFCSCALIDYIRQKTIEKALINIVFNIISHNKILTKYLKING